MIQIAVFLFFLLLFAGCPAFAGQGWELKQKGMFGGTYVIKLAPDAVFAKSVDNGTCILSRAPDWKIVYFNPQIKTRRITSVENWTGGAAQEYGALYREDWSDFEWKDCGAKTENGSKGRLYSLVRVKPGRKLASKNVFAATYFVSDEIQSNPKAIYVIEKLLRAPHMGKVPLELNYCRKFKGPNHLQIQTISTRRTQIDPKDFVVPKGLTDVSKDYQVLEGADADDVMKDISRF